MVNCFLNGVWLYLEGYMPAIILFTPSRSMMYKHSEQFFKDTCIISLITGWTVYTEKYKARGPDV